MNGELSGAGAAYAGLHGISPQMSAVAAAAVAAYGRTQVVPEMHTFFQRIGKQKQKINDGVHYKIQIMALDMGTTKSANRAC